MALIYLTIAWVLGILLADALSLPPGVLAAMMGIALGGLFLSRRRRQAVLALACLLSATLGAWRLLLSRPAFDEGALAFYNDRGWVTIEGYVSAEPGVRGAFTQLEISVESLREADGPARPVSGRLVANVPLYPTWEYGDALHAAGLLQTPPVLEGFDYREYLAARGVHSLLRRASVTPTGERSGSPIWRAVFSAKERLRRRLEELLPYPEVGLLTGIVLGLGHTLPDDLQAAYRATGLSHIIVISGFNISLLAQLLLLGSHAGLHRWPLLGASLALITLYTFFVGPSPPVSRAALMGGLALVGQLVGRRAHPPTSLAIASLVMTAANPLLLWSVSFQLSFAATLGMLLLDPTIRRGAEGLRGRFRPGIELPTWIREMMTMLSTTTSAQIATLPIIWGHFGQISLLALPANLLALPVQPAVMVLGLITALVAGLSLPIARVLAWVEWPLLRYTNAVVEGLGTVPWAAVEAARPRFIAVLAVYGASAALILGVKHKARFRAELGRLASRLRLLSWAVPTLALVTMALWWSIFSLPDGRLHLYALDVGQGDALLMRTPGGRYILVDGGPDPLLLNSRLGRILPFWQRRIDLVMATHGDGDHIAGLIPLLGRYRVTHVAQPPGIKGHGPLGDAWQQAVVESGAQVITARRGMSIRFGETELQVLHPDEHLPTAAEADDNARSMVLRLRMGRFSALLTGDMTVEVERQLLARGGLEPTTLLKVAHHGAADGTSAAWLQALRPALAVISVGAGNRFGHPRKEVLQRLEEAECFVLRTDRDGTIEIITDGQRCWVHTER
ncbi:MAG: DNA internalization-related competence protein ComEC/Rec2 [Chloroflexi bacterium]|nr:DNA internalization-related competence protein ComEC/Rec2 [Chloroflexota bacterium]